MARSKIDKSELLGAMAAHVLAHGLNTASLRPLAAAAGTSDRMLIYHFGTKDALISELLAHLAAQMAAGLDAALPHVAGQSGAEVLRQITTLMRSEAFAGYARVWLDIVSGAAQGQEAHGHAGHAVISGFLDWIAARLPGGAPDAALALTLIEGVLVMDAVGQSEVADAAIAALEARL